MRLRHSISIYKELPNHELRAFFNNEYDQNGILEKLPLTDCYFQTNMSYRVIMLVAKRRSKMSFRKYPLQVFVQVEK